MIAARVPLDVIGEKTALDAEANQEVAAEGRVLIKVGREGCRRIDPVDHAQGQRIGVPADAARRGILCDPILDEVTEAPVRVTIVAQGIGENEIPAAVEIVQVVPPEPGLARRCPIDARPERQRPIEKGEAMRLQVGEAGLNGLPAPGFLQGLPQERPVMREQRTRARCRARFGHAVPPCDEPRPAMDGPPCGVELKAGGNLASMEVTCSADIEREAGEQRG